MKTEEESKEGKYTLAMHLKDLTINKLEWDPLDDLRVKTYDPFMMNRYISMISFLVPYVERANKLRNPSKEIHYNYLLNALPKGNFFVKYIKAKKEPDREAKIESLCKYFEVGKSEAERKLKVLPVEVVEKINKLYNGYFK